MELCDIDWLPEAGVVMNRCRAAAAADAMLSSDPDLRQYWCSDTWKPGISVAHRHDGAGSHTYVVHSGDTTVIKVAVLRASIGPDSLARFQHKPDVDMPPLAIQVLNEPDFRYQELSFLAWSQGGAPWKGLMFRVDNLTSLEMSRPQLEMICTGAKTFYVYAQSYHEVTIDPPTLMQLFKLVPIDEAMAKKISPDVKWHKVTAELQAIGYPLA